MLPAEPSPTRGSDGLPAWRRVLAVVAHPDDESFGLGAVIDAFVAGGAQVAVVCLTSGEASTLGARPDLAAVREQELRRAAEALGVLRATLHGWPDGALAEADPVAVAADIRAAIEQHRPDGLLVFDSAGITGHPDHAAATRRAVEVAGSLGLPVLAWTLPADVAQLLNRDYAAGFHGHRDEEIDVRLRVSRGRQRRAIAAHRSQAVPGSVLWRRLELLGDREVLHWLVR